mmetsp:Transcript_11191/g.26913  ORF Transcript_11191/g.26913 Transcript_11191/m.26913 type:complete len:248 (+) Transcript_11191:187-930(+)
MGVPSPFIFVPMTPRLFGSCWAGVPMRLRRCCCCGVECSSSPLSERRNGRGSGTGTPWQFSFMSKARRTITAEDWYDFSVLAHLRPACTIHAWLLRLSVRNWKANPAMSNTTPLNKSISPSRYSATAKAIGCTSIGFNAPIAGTVMRAPSLASSADVGRVREKSDVTQLMVTTVFGSASAGGSVGQRLSRAWVGVMLLDPHALLITTASPSAKSCSTCASVFPLNSRMWMITPAAISGHTFCIETRS